MNVFLNKQAFHQNPCNCVGKPENEINAVNCKHFLKKNKLLFIEKMNIHFYE